MSCWLSLSAQGEKRGEEGSKKGWENLRSDRRVRERKTRLFISIGRQIEDHRQRSVFCLFSVCLRSFENRPYFLLFTPHCAAFLSFSILLFPFCLPVSIFTPLSTSTKQNKTKKSVDVSYYIYFLFSIVFVLLCFFFCAFSFVDKLSWKKVNKTGKKKTENYCCCDCSWKTTLLLIINSGVNKNQKRWK